MKTFACCFVSAFTGLVLGHVDFRKEKYTAVRKAYNSGIEYAVGLMHQRKIIYAPEHEVTEIRNCVLVQVVNANAAPVKMEKGGLVTHCQFYNGPWPSVPAYGDFWHDGAYEFFNKKLKEGQQ